MQDKTDHREKPRPRKAYHSPELTEYGSVAKLARGSQSQNSDHGAGHKSSSGGQQNQT
jgi:hypothetical protein